MLRINSRAKPVKIAKASPIPDFFLTSRASRPFDFAQDMLCAR
jgi:hypothetical protein